MTAATPRPLPAASDPTAGRAAAPAPGRPPSVSIRLAVMVYEAALLFAVLFVAGYALLAGAGWQHPLDPGQRYTLFALWLFALGVYFVWQWRAGRRTLPMKTWDLRLSTLDGRPLTTAGATLRYLLAWHLFAPAVGVIALFSPGPAASLAALVASPFAMLLTVYLDPGRQLLHDRLLGTRVTQQSPARR